MKNLQKQKINNNYRDPLNRNTEIHQLIEDCAKARIVAELIGFSLNLKDDLLGPTRGSSKAAFGRQLAMYLTNVGFGICASRVSRAFGRDKSTVSYACATIEDKRDEPDFDEYVDALQDILLRVPQFKI